MTPSLRQCPRCHLVFEGDVICPTCHQDIREPDPSDPDKSGERSPTGKVPVIPPKQP